MQKSLWRQKENLICSYFYLKRAYRLEMGLQIEARRKHLLKFLSKVNTAQYKTPY